LSGGCVSRRCASRRVRSSVAQTTSRSQPTRRVVHVFAKSAVAIATLVAVAPHASAVVLGAERVASYLGQTLRVEIPVVPAAGEQVEASCFALVPPSRRDGVPALRQGRIDLSADGQRLIVRSAANVDEPIVRFALDVGCATQLRREFTVLLDPAPGKGSGATLAEPTPPESSSARLPSPDNAATPTRSEAQTIASSPPREKTKRRADASDVAQARIDRKSAKTKRRDANDASRLVVKNQDGANTIDATALAALAVPRLRVSSDLPAWAASGDPNATGATPAPMDELTAAVAKERRARLAAAPIEEDLPARLEADLIVAKKRIAELQSQLGASTPNQTAVVAAPAATSIPSSIPTQTPKNETKKTEAIKTTGTAGSFDWRDWIWVPALLAVAGLFLYLLRQWQAQRKARSRWEAAAPVTVVHRDPTPTMSGRTSADASVDTMMPGVNPPTVTDNTTSGASMAHTVEKLENPLFHPNQTSSSLDVTELSHVTDEAQVYADLGRTNEAIEILAHHIDTHDNERPSPAPWLMLFDLLRKANRRADYDRLSPIFRKHFNGRLPEWEAYGSELALDDGLEAFPHLIARIERDWGTPPVRVFLDEMLYDNRGGSRLGFSLAAYKDLLLLAQLHDQLARDGKLQAAHPSESAGANDEDGTPKWDLALDMIEPPKPGELDEFLAGRKPPESKPS
jgi:pilus assembly protein FimV